MILYIPFLDITIQEGQSLTIHNGHFNEAGVSNIFPVENFKLDYCYGAVHPVDPGICIHCTHYKISPVPTERSQDSSLCVSTNIKQIIITTGKINKVTELW